MTLKNFKDIFATLPFVYRVGRTMLPVVSTTGDTTGMSFCSCIRAKSATHFPMYHRLRSFYLLSSAQVVANLLEEETAVVSVGGMLGSPMPDPMAILSI